MRYREFAPDPRLRGHVACFWLLEAETQSRSQGQRIVPDGCSEVVFQLAQPNRVWLEGRIREEPRAFLVSQLTGPLELFPASKTRNLGIRFRPGGLYPFLRRPIHELTDQVLALEQVWHDLARSVLSRLDPETGADELISVVQTELLTLQREFFSHSDTRALVMRILAQPQARLGRLSREAGSSLRQIQRRFRREVGVGPKQLGRVLRFQQLVEKSRVAFVRRIREILIDLFL